MSGDLPGRSMDGVFPDLGAPEPDVVAAPEAASGPDRVAAPQGFLERLSNSVGALVFGLILLPLACVGLFWNEGRAVGTERALREGQAQIRTVSTDRRDPSADGRLVHVAGQVVSPAGVRDEELGVQAKGLRLSRKVEMFQWTETETGSGQDRTFTYAPRWSELPVESSRFRAPSGHQNPGFGPIRSRDFTAGDARIGAIPIGSAPLARLGPDEDMAVDAGVLESARRVLGRSAQLSGGSLHVGRDPQLPRVGDLRVSYRVLREGPASFAGQQSPTGLVEHRASNGETFLLASAGIVSSDALFAQGQDDNRVLTWILRLVGLLVLFVALRCLFAPATLLASVVPVLGGLVSGAVGLVCLVAASAIGLSVIAVAWLAYRPLLSVVLLAGAAALLFSIRTLRRRARPAPPERAPAV